MKYQEYMRDISQLKSVGQRVLIDLIDAESMTESGIIIPDSVAETSQFGNVLSVGHLVKFIKDGDLIMFNKFDGTDVFNDMGKRYVSIIEDYVSAIIDKTIDVKKQIVMK